MTLHQYPAYCAANAKLEKYRESMYRMLGRAEAYRGVGSSRSWLASKAACRIQQWNLKNYDAVYAAVDAWGKEAVK